jgi:hypothetical protein
LCLSGVITVIRIIKMSFFCFSFISITLITSYIPNKPPSIIVEEGAFEFNSIFKFLIYMSI